MDQVRLSAPAEGSMAWPMPTVTLPPGQRDMWGTRPSKLSSRGMTSEASISVDQLITDGAGTGARVALVSRQSEKFLIGQSRKFQEFPQNFSALPAKGQLHL